jgi:protoheme IX farnesyltransferase
MHGPQATETPTGARRVAQTIRAYLMLTKPSILLLVVLTGAAGLVVEGSLNDDPLRFLAVLVFLGMAGASANTFNQYFERDVDAVMRRTRKRRPLPKGLIKPAGALVYAVAMGAVSTVVFAVWFNLLSAALALATILFYSLYYTLYLKPRTPQNIVIGGLAGSMGPVIAWAAAAGSLAWTPVIMAAVIFFWTPPHFWSLAIYLREDYEAVGYPMMPGVKGVPATWRQIFFYTVVTIALSVALYFFEPGWLYLVAALGLGVWMLFWVIRGWRSGSDSAARGVFGVSIVYLLALFFMVIVDRGLLA